MPRPKTRVATLYRLPEVAPDPDAMFDALLHTIGAIALDARHADAQPLTITDCPALWVAVQSERSEADWCAAASLTTGLELHYGRSTSAGLLMIGVDGITYALGYGGGHHLIKDELKDPRFGLAFAVRRVNPLQIQDLVRRRPGARGRLDTTLVPGGLPVWALGVTEHAEIVRRLGGPAPGDGFAFSAADNRQVRVYGSVGLRMPFGLMPADYVAHIREIARVCAEEKTHPALEFVEHILPITDRKTREQLDRRLDDLLGSGTDDDISPVVPTGEIDDFAHARAFVVTISGKPAEAVTFLDATHILSRVRRYRPGRRISALRGGRVTMYADNSCRESLGTTSAAKWVEASASIGSRRFFLLDGDWYEIDAEYARTARAEIASLFTAAPTLDLPPWRLGRDDKEREYNLSVPILRDGYVCLDRDKSVRNPLGASSSLEICDLFGPDEQLIHVKHASSSAPLSHVFSQGLVSAQSLLNSPDVRRAFAAQVAAAGRGRTIPPDFTPKKVVFAILLKDGQELTPRTPDIEPAARVIEGD